MRVQSLARYGTPEKAFEIREVDRPTCQADEVLVKAEGFGLNFADIMARKGLYQDCPPLPAVIGYDVVGEVVEVGAEVESVKLGQRVTALTRFGGYAEYAITRDGAVAAIPDDMPLACGLALATQYCTAYFCANEMAQLHEGDHVLVHAAAGGVGTALVQWAKHRGCIVYGTASKGKFDHLRKMGVDHPINYREEKFDEKIKAINGTRGLDVIFDAIGGSTFKKGYKLLGSGGRLIGFGASDISNARTPFGKLGTVIGFGLWHPIQMLMTSKSMLGVNMLRIADDRPETFRRVLENVVKYTEKGVFRPVASEEFTFEDLPKAHEFLEGRKSIGKIAVRI